jgi:hypothetical protein
MDENLVGYLIGALDPDTERAVEGHLRINPEARRKLERFRQALEPLEADREEIVPPPGLRIRTLARVAEYRSRGKARVPPAPPVRRPSPVSISWWRRADVLVAASLLFLCLALLLPWLAKAQRARSRLECMNNLLQFYQALVVYSDHHHGELPSVEDSPPRNFAGVLVPILHQESVLTKVSLSCPGTGEPAPALIPIDQVEELARQQPRKFDQYTHQAGGCYAYPLGYRTGGQLHGLRLDPDLPYDQLPMLADRPPFEDPNAPDLLQANSENHGGEGQNVLFMSGRVQFYKSRNVGWNGDDIYLNQNRRLEPGISRMDVVLAASPVRTSQSPPLEH